MIDSVKISVETFCDRNHVKWTTMLKGQLMSVGVNLDVLVLSTSLNLIVLQEWQLQGKDSLVDAFYLIKGLSSQLLARDLVVLDQAYNS